MQVKIINKSNNPLPKYATEGSAGLDLAAFLPPGETRTLYPMGRMLIPTGIYIELPPGYEAQVRPRSGLALKKGITVLNAPGTVDSDYRGEVGVMLINLSDQPFTINNGDRIGQMIIAQYAQAELVECVEISDTERGSGGFGHTGV